MRVGKMYKFFSLSILLFLSFCSSAYVVWPGASAPCNSTLQACINGSSEGEYISIETDSLINESIFSTKIVSLVAGNGYHPVFAAGNSIYLQSNTATARTITIKGLTLSQGKITVSHIGTNNTLNILNNTILSNPSDFDPGIQVLGGSNASLQLHVNYNRVNIDAGIHAVGDLPPHIYGGIIVDKQGGEVGNITGEIYNNTIHARGIAPKGIAVLDSTNASIDLNVVGNEVFGAYGGGLYINSSSGGTMDIDIFSNAFLREYDLYTPSGIHIVNDAGTSSFRILNNTVIEGWDGIHLEENGGSMTSTVINNLIAYCATGLNLSGGGAVSNSYNLIYQNASNSYTPAASDITSNPEIVSMTNARLRSNSPADGAGNSFAVLPLIGDVPLVDADGSYRIKYGTNGVDVDIGAYERGEVNYVHRHTGTGTHITNLNHPDLNGDSNIIDLHVTSNNNPNGTGGVNNNANEGVYYASGLWRIFNQETAVVINFSAAFNIWKNNAISDVFQHTVSTPGANTTSLNNSGLNNNTNKILMVTQHWIGTYNPHPVGVLYSAPNWRIANFDLMSILVDASFNVYFQDKSKSAWEHIANTKNTVAHYTLLDNPLLEGIPCAQIQVTQSASQGVFNNSPIGVVYIPGSSQWAIYNQNLSAMPVNAAFHVMISPEQIMECTDLIFKNGFE